MTHFTCLVAAHNEDELNALMLPFHEYECTGIEKYLQWVPKDMDKLREDHQEYHPEMSFDEFVPDWCGAIQNEKGEWGRWTNPNKQWDWWTIGGRFRGNLILKDGATASWANNASIDWTAIKQGILNRRARQWDKWQQRPDGKPGLKWLLDNDFGLLDKDEEDDLNDPKEKYVRLEALTRCFVGADGKWNQVAQHGWFGIAWNYESDYPQRFWEFVDSLPGEINVYSLDCHI